MSRLTLAAALLACAAARPAAAAGPFDDLLKHAPANTNTLALIDVKGAFSSPLAKAEKWAERGQPGNRGLGFVPPDAVTVVIATELNLSALTRDFQVGLVKVGHNVPGIREIAAREGGTVDEIAGRPVVLSPRDVYFTSLSGSEFVAAYPADRQYTARYLRAARAGRTGDLSPYLRKAADDAGRHTLTVAIDLEDAVDRTVLRMALPSSPAVAKVKTVDVNLLASFLAGVKGMTFTAAVTDAVAASITFEFSLEPERFRITLPDLLRELIEGQGIAIPGFEKWEPKFAGNTITMSGPLTSADLKRIVSLFSFPQLPGEAEPADKGGPSAAMTKRYLAAVDSILADVRALRETPNYEKMATWHDKAAQQIEQLRRTGVDPLASDAGFEAAKRLRAIGASLRGVPIDKKALESQQFYHTSGGASLAMVPGGWYGWRPFVTFGPQNVETNIPKIQAEIAKVVANDRKLRQETWSDIERVLVEVRRKLGDKYKGEF